MARYIDADALIAEYDRVHVGPAGGARKLMVDAPAADVAPVHHAYWKVVTVIKEDCACGSNRLMQYKVCSHCEQPMGVCGSDYCGHCGAIMDGFVLEGHSDPTGHDGPCGEPGMDAVTFAKREVENYKKLFNQLLDDFTHAMHYAGKNNNVCNFCEHDCGEGGMCKGRENRIHCHPKWRELANVGEDAELKKKYTEGEE